MNLIYQFLHLSFTVFCSLDALKKSSNKKETSIKKEIVEVLQQASTVEIDQDDEFLGFDLRFVS